MIHDSNTAALLVDADNLSLEGVVEALAHLSRDGHRVTLRRAYGSHETLAVLKDLLHAESFRAIVNQGKGTTDAGLVVDVMDLLHAGCLPRLVAIGSGDGDFAPLVVRLREAGTRVTCFAQRKKAAEGLHRFYDEVIFVDEPRRPVASAPVKRAAAKSTPKAAAPTGPSPTDLVRRLLESFPGFLAGKEIELNEVVKKLRDEKLMAKSTSARNFFKKHAPDVKLLPDKQPNKLQLPPRKAQR